MSASVLNTAVEPHALPTVAIGCSVSEWLQNQARYCDDVPTLLGEVARRLCQADVPLHRCGFVLPTQRDSLSRAKLASEYAAIFRERELSDR